MEGWQKFKGFLTGWCKKTAENEYVFPINEKWSVEILQP